MLTCKKKIWCKKHFDQLASFLVKNSYAILIGGLILMACCFYQALQLEIDSDYMAFLPEDFPSVKNLKKVIQKTGGFGNFMIVLEGADLEERRSFAQRIAERAQELPWVDYAEYRKDWAAIENNKLLYVSLEDLQTIHDRIEQTVSYKKNPLLISFFRANEPLGRDLDFSDIERKYQRTSFGSDYFEDPELKYTIALVWPKGSMTDLDFARKAYGDLNALVQELTSLSSPSSLKVTLGGEYRTKIDEYASLMHDLVGSALFSFAGVCLLIVLFYRRKRAIFFVLIPLVFGMILSFGVANILVGRLNLLTVFLIAILFGLGVDYGIYLYSRYVEERLKRYSVEQAVSTILFETGRATLGAALTTAMAFFVLMFTGFKGFQELGLVAGFGVLILFLTFFFYAPVLWIQADKWGLFHQEKYKAPRLVLKVLPTGQIYIWVGLFVGLIGFWSLFHIVFEYDYGKLRSTTNTYWEVQSKIHQVFPLSKTPAVILTDSLEEAKSVVQELVKKIPNLKTVDTVKSVVDFMPETISQKKKKLAQIKQLILNNQKFMNEEDQKVARSYLPYLDTGEIHLDQLPKGLLRYFLGINNTPGYLIFIYDKVALSDARNALLYADEIGEVHVQDKTYYASEGSIIFAKALDLMKNRSRISVCFILIVVLMILIWNFKSFKKAVIVFIPLIIGLLVTWGVMYFCNLKFNIFNLVLFPLFIGIGIDGNLHLYQRYLEGLQDKHVTHHLLQAANALLFATLTTMVGFGSMLFSNHQGLRSVGEIALIGFLSQLCVTLFFFPSLIHLQSYFVGRRS